MAPGATRIFVDTQANRQMASDLRRNSHRLAEARLTLLRAEQRVGPPPANVGPIKQTIQEVLARLASTISTLQRQADEVVANADALDRAEGVTTDTPVVDRMMAALFNTAGKGVGAAEWVLHQWLNLEAVPPYFAYFAAFKGNQAIHGAVDHLPGPLHDVAEVFTFPIRTGLAGLEGLGLGGDMVIDWIKGHTVAHETTADEGFIGPINPFHDWLPGPLKGPEIYLPGVHADGHVDFVW